MIPNTLSKYINEQRDSWAKGVDDKDLEWTIDRAQLAQGREGRSDDVRTDLGFTDEEEDVKNGLLCSVPQSPDNLLELVFSDRENVLMSAWSELCVSLQNNKLDAL